MPTKANASTTAKKADAAKDAPAKKVNPALMKPLQPSKELAAVVGSDPLPRAEVVSKVWDYIKTHKLQDPQNKREIMADEKFQAVFGKDRVTMFEMNKHLAQHLTKRPAAPDFVGVQWLFADRHMPCALPCRSAHRASCTPRPSSRAARSSAKRRYLWSSDPGPCSICSRSISYRVSRSATTAKSPCVGSTRYVRVW